MDVYDRYTNLGKKNLADSVAIYGRGRELLRPSTYNESLKLIPHPSSRTLHVKRFNTRLF